MKHVKKILVLVMAAVMCMAMALPVMAATIEVKDVIDGEQYTAYKILNYRDNDGSGQDRAVSYYLTSEEYNGIGSILEGAGLAFTMSSDGTEYFVNNAAVFDPAGAAAYLGDHLEDLGNALGKAVASGAAGSAVFDDLDAGYYFVTSSAGSLCALHEDTDIATLVEKNTIPAVDKKVKAGGEDYQDDPVDANIGDTVHFQIVITDGTGTNAVIAMTDTMTEGLDYIQGSMKINETAAADDEDTDNWRITVSGHVITVEFKASYVESLPEGGTITVTYDAAVNEKAVVDSADGNENKVELEYSQQQAEDRVYVQTYDFLVKKTDGSDFLDGAEFKLYDAEQDGDQILLSLDGDGYYKDVNGNIDTTIDIDTAEGCNVRGLAPGTYYLEEVVVPNGYNKLSERKEVVITSGQTTAVEIEVVNNRGSVLPSTGGIGTTIFYIAGAALVIGAGVILVTRRRMGSE